MSNNDKMIIPFMAGIIHSTLWSMKRERMVRIASMEAPVINDDFTSYTFPVQLESGLCVNVSVTLFDEVTDE